MTEPKPTQKRIPPTWMIWCLIAICVLVELILIGADYEFYSTTRMRGLAYQYGGFWSGLLQDWTPNYTGQPYVMFVSYAFLHGGFTHLLVNMVSLYSLARPVLGRIGSVRFGVLYFLTAIGGAVGFALLSDSFRPMVGASGALFGLAGAILAWEYVDRFAAQKQLWPVLRLVLLLVALNLILWWAMDGQLAWQTHLGGFVAGWVVALLVDPRAKPVESA